MGKKHGRRPKDIIPSSLPKVRVSTRDSACSPVPEFLNVVSPHTESTFNCADVLRSVLPKIKVVDLDRSAKKTLKMEFVASKVNGVVSITAETVKVKFSVADTNWFILLKKKEGENLYLLWRIAGKVYANHWKVTADLNWICSTTADSEEKKAKRWKRSTSFDPAEGYNGHWLDVADEHWRPLVTLPEEGQTLHTIVYVDLELTVKEIQGFRLRDSFSYDFKEPNKDSDLVFRFNDGDVYINCSYLALISDYFSATKDRLSTMKKNENGFPFEEMVEMDVDMEEFVELLEVVYPSGRKVTDKNISFILALADRFLFVGALRGCERFLMSKSSKIDVFLKLLWSSEYTMNDLHEWCLSKFKARTEIDKVLKSEHYKALKKTGTIMTALFEKSAALVK